MACRAHWGVQVLQQPALTGVGVEHLRWQGGWQTERRHHRSAFDDTAWRVIRARGLVDSWVHDLAMVDVVEGVYLDRCAAVSLARIRFSGHAGHTSLHARRSTNIWMGDWRDATELGYVHGPGCGYGSAGLVYWRGTMHPE